MNNVDFEEPKEKDNSKETRHIHLNIGTGKDLPIKDLAILIKVVLGFKGEILWDSSKPDGKYRKSLDVTKINTLGCVYKISLKDGITRSFQD